MNIRIRTKTGVFLAARQYDPLTEPKLKVDGVQPTATWWIVSQTQGVGRAPMTWVIEPRLFALLFMEDISAV